MSHHPASAPFAPLSRARLARLNPPIRIAASCAPLEEHARTSRDAFVVFEDPCARDSNGTQAIRARTSLLSTATTLAHADRDAVRSLGRPRIPRLHTGSLALPPKTASVAATPGSCALGLCFHRVLLRTRDCKGQRCVRPTSATRTINGEHPRLVMFPALFTARLFRSRASSDGLGPARRPRARARRRAPMGLGPVDAERLGSRAFSRRATSLQRIERAWRAGVFGLAAASRSSL